MGNFVSASDTILPTHNRIVYRVTESKLEWQISAQNSCKQNFYKVPHKFVMDSGFGQLELGYNSIETLRYNSL